jgi:hypothetical protein
LQIQNFNPHYHHHQGSSLDSWLTSQVIPVHILILFFVHVNILLPFMFGSKRSLNTLQIRFCKYSTCSTYLSSLNVITTSILDEAPLYIIFSFVVMCHLLFVQARSHLEYHYRLCILSIQCIYLILWASQQPLFPCTGLSDWSF